MPELQCGELDLCEGGDLQAGAVSVTAMGDDSLSHDLVCMTSCVGVVSDKGLVLYTSKAVRRRYAEVLEAAAPSPHA